MNKRVKTILIASVSLLIIGAIAYPKLKPMMAGNPQSQQPQAQAQAKNAPLSLKGVVLIPTKLDNLVFATGTILPNEEVELRSESSGRIVKMYIKEDTRVKKGDLLVKVNDAELQAQLQKAELRRKLAADREYRQKALLKKEGTSQEIYEGTLSELNTAIAEIDLLKAQIQKTEIRAPFDGTVGLKFVSEGAIIQPTMTIATLRDVNSVKIDFVIPEKYMSLVKKGDKITFQTESSDKKFQASVYATDPEIDQTTRSLRLRAFYPNNSSLVPGAFVKIQLTLDETPDALLVPTEAVIPELKGQKVFVFRDGKAQPQSVTLGVRTDRAVQITGGVQAGDTIITTGIMQLRPGAAVKLSEVQ